LANPWTGDKSPFLATGHEGLGCCYFRGLAPGCGNLRSNHVSRPAFNCEELLKIARSLEGHLTATIHGTQKDLHEFADLIAILEQKFGQLGFNGFPTGVELCPATGHGGPYPSTSDGRSTSVETRAIFRFTQPVCYQGFPDDALPEELKNANPLGIWRMVDGQMTREATLPVVSNQK